VVAGVVAGTLATLAQLILWFAAGEDAVSLLWRDARLTAALALGTKALLETDPDPAIFGAATGVHFLLSVVYAALLLPVARRLAPVPALLAGAVLGGLLYCLNLYGFTSIFAWFAEARGGITLAVHAVFGIVVMATYRFLDVPRVDGRAGG
jgi:hypothetical protein